ncbi:MAG: UbiD family decarboxylase [Chloroflexi bacterium]|nr:UbiD family decarboxylase [Chloroflexota bacterium]
MSEVTTKQVSTTKGARATPYRDLREWLQRVEEMGELRQIEGADWDIELATITDLFYGKRQSEENAALLFDKIKGYPQGHRVLCGALSSIERIALTTNMPSETNDQKFIQAWRQVLKNLKPMPPDTVKSGPVMENVHTGKDIDLFEFPTPRWTRYDGGRYIGTGDAVITRDPDEGWVNIGTYRVMIHDKNTLGIFIDVGKHGSIHRDKYFEKGKPFPIAISFGHDPLLYLVGSRDAFGDLTEYEIAGAIKGEPIQVITGEVTGLPIPASAEIVIEGECTPDDTIIEGPFPEWPGHYGTARPEPAIRVKSVMHRHNPIILAGYAAGNFHAAVSRAAALWNDLEALGIPDIRGVSCQKGTSGGRFFHIVSIKQRYPGHARQTALAVAASRVGAYLGKYIIVVDDDIDPYDINEVLWAIGTRSDPERSIDIIRRCWSSYSLDPGIPPDKKGFNSRAIIDACKPYEWINDFPRVVEIDTEARERVLQKWGKVLSDLA